MTVDSAATSTATNPETTLVAERLAAVRGSGWGARIRFVQPRNPAFWVYVVITGWGLITLVRYLSAQAPVYGQVIIVAAVLFGLYGALFWWFTQHIDRYAHQSRAMAVLAAVWGGLGATLALASPANTPILSLWAKAFGQAWASDWGAGLTAPFVEELAKGSGLLLLIALVPRAVATAFDGFILGAFIGLGFQIAEDVTYALGSAGDQFGANPVGNALTTIVFRIALGVASHALYSAVFCAGLVYALGRPAQPRRLGRGILLMLTAMALHGVWDDLGGIVGANFIFMVLSWIVVITVAVLIAVRVYKVTVVPERAYMRAVLAPEAANGTLTTEELDTLAGNHQARKAYRKADRAHRRQRTLVLEAARDLADELARSGGTDNDRVRYARQEVIRVRPQPGAKVGSQQDPT
ncbi:MAG: PrsW family intramembrane metalloprotease [Propionibacteriaceae bacterium]